MGAIGIPISMVEIKSMEDIFFYPPLALKVLAILSNIDLTVSYSINTNRNVQPESLEKINEHLYVSLDYEGD